MPLTDTIQALFTILVWGLNFVAVKVVLGWLPPFFLTGLRFAAVALLAAPFFRVRRDQLPLVALIGVVLGAGHFGLIFFGLNGMDAASASIATQLGVPFSALLAWAVFGETLGWARAAGMALAFGGVAILAGEPNLPHLLPLLSIVAGMMAWALSNVLVKKLGAVHPLALNGWMAVFASPLLLAASFATEHGQLDGLAAAPAKAWAGLTFTVVASSLVAYTLWYRLLARHAMNKVVPYTLLGPVIGVIGGVALLGEPLTWHKLVGGAVTIAGVAAVQLAGRAKPQPEPEHVP